MTASETQADVSGPAALIDPIANWLVVDLDGTLLRTDLLYESVAIALCRAPWLLLLMPFWLVTGGKAAVKRRLAERIAPDLDTLPVNDGLLVWLRSQKSRGRPIALVSASDHRLVQRIAARFDGLFDAAEGSDGTTNLSGLAKLALIRRRFGADATYVGDSGKDTAVWRGTGRAILAGRNVEGLGRRLPADLEVANTFPVPGPTWRTWARAARLHQWAKNGLVFVAPLLAGILSQPASLLNATLAFFAFGLMASATYLVNDLVDLPTDRLHPTKSRRPLASGALPIRDALIAIPFLGLATAGVLVLLPVAVTGVAAIYVVVTVAYSLYLKRMPILDLLVLAFLFTIRIMAGIAAAGNDLTPWLLTFSMFFFLSLAGIKRFTECRTMAAGGHTRLPGRGYGADDASWLMAMGAASGYCSILVFFIYLVDDGSPIRGYATPELLWLVCIVLGYWLSRIWLLATRGEMNDDPVLFALKDRVSLVLGAVTVLTVVLARI